MNKPHSYSWKLYKSNNPKTVFKSS